MKKILTMLALLAPAAAGAQTSGYPRWMYYDSEPVRTSAYDERDDYPPPRASQDRESYPERESREREPYPERESYPERRSERPYYPDREYYRDGDSDRRRYSDREYYPERDRDYYPDRRSYSETDRRAAQQQQPAAVDDAVHPYIGIDVSQFKVKFNDSGDDELGTSYNAYTINIGAKFSQYFGAELFYKSTLKKKADGLSEIAPSVFLPVTYETGFTGFGVGLNGYMPLASKFYFEPTLGFGSYKGSVDMCSADTSIVTGCESNADDKTLGIMLGAGVSFAASEGFDLRAGYRITTFSEDEFSMKNFSEIYLGFRGVF
ncbi:MAG: outer membrane beta-barrel protein [Rickettsiales bacterium]|jgi:opacity protein-like surface antigen|nr:outer membrane beta-barrel protein [Rickettsiales bacterium]